MNMLFEHIYKTTDFQTVMWL